VGLKSSPSELCLLSTEHTSCSVFDTSSPVTFWGGKTRELFIFNSSRLWREVAWHIFKAGLVTVLCHLVEM
jgi:hypothetical protein